MMKRKKRLSAALLALGICISLISPVSAKAAEVTENTGISTNAIPGWPQAQEDVYKRQITFVSREVGTITLPFTFANLYSIGKPVVLPIL